MLQLRDTQAALIEHARAELRAGCRRLLIQGATGFGKTVIAAQMLASAAARGRRCWFVVHRVELLRQSIETFVQAADIHTGIVAAGFPMSPLAPVQVCSVGTLRKRAQLLAPPDLIVIDEAHHCPAKTWADVMAAVPGAVQIGLTATPQRLDGKGLGKHFDRMICGPTTAELIRDGWLSPYRLYAPSQVDVSKVHRVAGDYNKREVNDTMRASTVVGDAVGTYLAHCTKGGGSHEAEHRQARDSVTGEAHPINTPTGGRALVFAWSLEASQALASAFRDAGVPAAHVDGETSAQERLAALRGFRDGSLRVLCNVDLFGEGLDVPSVDAVFLLRPTQSLGLYLQQVGRGLRPSLGKAAVRLFDHVGNYTRHGLPDDPREWSLASTAAARSSDAPKALKRCPSCFGVAGVLTKMCPYCGAPYPVKPRTVHRVAGELAEVGADTFRGQLVASVERMRACRTLEDWQALAKEAGYKAGWAWYQFQLRRGRQLTARPRPEPVTAVALPWEE